MSAFADDLRILVDDMKASEVQHTLDEDLKLKWTESIGPNWTRYLGKEWRDKGDGTFEVRVPPKYWQGLLEEAGLVDTKP
eukprot:6141806-Heterocapsa_arctica.AAC.1